MYSRYEKIVKLAPWIASENLGDQIIRAYCESIIADLFPEALTLDVSTRDNLSNMTMRHILSADYTLLCGTNILSSTMNKFSQWHISLADVYRMKLIAMKMNNVFNVTTIRETLKINPVILFGVGWWQYQEKPNAYTQKLLKLILSSKGIHSVRDEYTCQMLHSIGITNVVNTACPTMWKLTPEHCEQIPQKKSNRVVTTLTNYNFESSKDYYILETLLNEYNEVYVWLQAIEDYELLAKSPWFNRVKIIPPSLKAYDRFLLYECDYVGTRLHGGIRALNNKRRSLIIAVDNRAIEISKDTNLPVISRNDVENNLVDEIRKEKKIEIHLPEKNISIWKSQFKK